MAKLKPTRERRSITKDFPSFSDMLNVAVDVITEDWQEKVDKYKPGPGFAEELIDGKIPEKQLFYDPSYDNYTCSEMINKLILDLPAPGAAYYLITNGWYIGQMGDYGACEVNTLNGSYMLITVDGDYAGAYPFTRGSYGKY